MDYNEPTLPRNLMLVSSGSFQAMFWVGYALDWDGVLLAVFIILSGALIAFNPWIYQGD